MQAWSVETDGRFDLDAELELWFPGLDLSHLDFKGQVDVRTIGKLIGQYVLQGTPAVGRGDRSRRSDRMEKLWGVYSKSPPSL